MNSVSVNRTKPTFIIIGEQKAGTGWLRDRLQEHPDVYICDKELNFFSQRRLFDKGENWYFSNFAAAAGKLAVGEKSPDYFWINSGRSDYLQDIDQKIDEALGSVNLILLLRNPVDRAVSAFMHHLRHRGRRIPPGLVEKYSPLQLLVGEAINLQRYGVIERGFYAERVEAFQKRFGDRLLTLVFEDDIVTNPQRGMRRVCEHIGIDYDVASFQFRLNPKADKPSLRAIKMGYWVPVLRPLIRQFGFGERYQMRLSTDERQKVAELYKDDVVETRRLIDRDVWLQDWPL